MKAPLRVGVAGVGRWGAEHARVLAARPDVELAGVHDRDRDRGCAVASRCGTRHRASLGRLLEEVDALVVAVPTVHHHAVAREALERGVHLLVEKPFTTTLDEADDLIERASASGATLAVGHVERFNAAVRACRPYLASPRFVESLRLAPFRPRGTDVTVVLDLMIHDIDLVLGLVDSPLVSVDAVGTPVLTDSVDIANARLRFANGGVAEITASRVSESSTRVLRLFQSTGYLRLDLADGSGEFLRRREPPPVLGEEGPAPALGDWIDRLPLCGDGTEPLELELDAFLAAVRGDSDRIVSAQEGRAALEIALRIGREIERFKDVALETA